MQKFSHSLLIYDKKLDTIPAFKKWRRQYSLVYAVSAGEQLKALEQFPKHISKILKLTQNIPSRELTIMAAGGGSVLDFTGFIASTLKRGVKFISVPTTWLAAIDAAHGGKTALNAAGAKNQVGTFYPADQILLKKEFLYTQPAERAEEAFAELLKIALLDGEKFFTQLEKSKLTGHELLWEFLEQAIAAKMKIVQKDPFEKNGQRRVLNLGHTFGHVFEAELGWAHGKAVAAGLMLALSVSMQQADLPFAYLDRALLLLDKHGPALSLHISFKNPKRLKELLVQDKKREGTALSFVLLQKPGKAIIQSLPLAYALSVLSNLKKHPIKLLT